MRQPARDAEHARALLEDVLSVRATRGYVLVAVDGEPARDSAACRHDALAPQVAVQNPALPLSRKEDRPRHDVPIR